VQVQFLMQMQRCRGVEVQWCQGADVQMCIAEVLRYRGAECRGARGRGGGVEVQMCRCAGRVHLCRGAGAGAESCSEVQRGVEAERFERLRGSERF
jgi:hypothetical protein